MISDIDSAEVNKVLFSQPPPSFPENIPAEKIQFIVPGEVRLECYYFESSPESPIVLFFPSAMANISHFLPFAGEFQSNNISVLYIGYRGHGTSTGTPSLALASQDAVFLVNHFQESLKQDGKNNEIFLMGQSLGTVFAIDATLHHKDKIKGLILDSSICHTRDFLISLGVDGSTINLPEEKAFNTLGKIENIKLPTIIFHGANDPLVATADAESLQSHSGARIKQFFIVPGGSHGDLFHVGGKTYFQTLKNFVDTTCGRNTWRHRRREKRKK